MKNNSNSSSNNTNVQPENINVLIATPLGIGGKGGIDRMTDKFRAELERNPLPGIDVTILPTRGQKHIVLSPFCFFLFITRMISMRWHKRLDLLHINLASHGSTYRKLIVATIARIIRVPYVIHLRGALFHEFYENSPNILRVYITKFFNQASGIIVLGTVWRDFVTSHFPDVNCKISILPNSTPGIEKRHIGGKENLVILFLGEVGERKGVPQLIDALKYLEGMPSWKAVLAGNGDIDGTRSRIIQLGLEHRIHLAGWKNPSEVADLISRSDILVLPSFAENLPNSIIEAMASGLAVVATPVGAIEDIIVNEETGLLIPPGDVQALAVALERLIQDRVLRQRIGSAAAEFHKKNLEISVYATALGNLWRRALD